MIRQLIWERDRGICGICHEWVEFGPAMNVDHIIHLCVGGSDDLSNLRATHAICNSRRPLPESFLVERRENPKLAEEREMEALRRAENDMQSYYRMTGRDRRGYKLPRQ